MTTGRLVVVMVAAIAAAVIAIVVAARLDRSPARPNRTGTPTPSGAPRVVIPAIGVDAPLVAIGLLPGGAMQLPGFGCAGWYERGPQPGEAGPAVVVAQVDTAAGEPDVFHRLPELRSGDRVTVRFPGHSATFAVTAKERAAHTELPASRIWNGASTPVLRLITCGGGLDQHAAGFHDNVIVYADRLVA